MTGLIEGSERLPPVKTIKSSAHDQPVSFMHSEGV